MTIAAAWSWRILVVAAAALGLILLAARFYLPVLPFFFALLLTALLHPLLEAMRRLKLSQAMATWATIMIALLVIAGVGWFVWARAAASYTQLVAQVEVLANQLRGDLGRVPGANTTALAQLQQSAVSWLQQHTNTVIGGVLSFGTVLGELVTGVLVTLFLTFYFLEQGDRIWSWVVRLCPANVQPSIRGAGYRSWHALSGWVVGTALIALFHGVIVGLTLFFLNVPLAVALAVLVFLGSFIPIIGSFLFGGLAVLVTLASQGPVPALVVLAILVIDSQIEAHLLQPFVVGRAVALHPVAIVLALTAGGVIGGIFGAIIVIPIVASIHAAVKYLTGVEDLSGNPCRVDADRMAPEPPAQYAPLPLYAVTPWAAPEGDRNEQPKDERPQQNVKRTEVAAASELEDRGDQAETTS